MKKTIFSLAFITLISCNQNQESQDIDNLELIEFSEQQLSDLVSTKPNDTIYITNFFATWCQPCMHEIPYFKEKMDKMKDEKVKFTFVNIDNPKIWNSTVLNFAQQSGLGNNIILFNNSHISADFYSKNFETWDGSSIPFTIITKGNQKDETIGMMRKEELTHKINAIKQ